MQPCACAAETDQASTPLMVRLRHLYVCAEMSTYQIGEIVGMNRQRVTQMLRRAGVQIRARGAGRVRPRRRAYDPPALRTVLEELYLRRRLTSGQIARLVGMPERRIRDRLREFGIPVRTRGQCNREDRTTLEGKALAEMYVGEQMSADKVAEALGVSRMVVLRNAHELGLPVRVSGPSRDGTTAPQIELVEALYADPPVRRTLERHRIPQVPPGGPIWQRFPDPIPLSKELLHDLYAECGVGSQHIELLTGQPSENVRRALSIHGIPLRRPGGRSPFMRRWLADPR